MFDLAHALKLGTSQECTLVGIALDTPHTFFGTKTQAMHEAFHVSCQGQIVEVVQNLACSPPVPIMPGDSVKLHGELVPYGYDGPLIHWTHHDPHGRHEDGYIEVGGRRYA